jgi:hypothetical protein
MFLAPTSGDIGVQPHGHTARVINRSGGALVVGDLVVTSFAHASVTYPATTIAQARLTPFANVVKADGNASTPGYLGAVVDVGSSSGANNTEVVVQFGGAAKVKTTATGAVAIGSVLGIADASGALIDSTGAATSTYPAGIALQALGAGNTAVIDVLLPSDIWLYADIP